ncbi:hypothetical protein GCM10020255_074060 [Rhodococcus baikonurensis]
MTDQFDGLLTDFSDEVLVDSAMLGDHAAFDVIVRRYGPHLYRFARRLVTSESDVDDIVQETCLAAWRQLPGFQRRSSIKTWLFAICSRKIADVHRKVGSCAADVDGLRDEVDTRCAIRARKYVAQHFSTLLKPNSIVYRCVSAPPGSCGKSRA